MNRQYYLDLAAAGARVPIGADLVLREKPDHEAILLDGVALGRVLEEAAHRYRTPLAFHLMDLMVEKVALLEAFGIPAEAAETIHFAEAPAADSAARLERHLNTRPPTPRFLANVQAIRHVATQTDLLPIGMSIGPFSLASKLIADPITPVYMAGMGENDPEIQALERILELSLAVILFSLRMQIEAGAKAILVAEPAANKAYFSPIQLAAGADIFDRFVMRHNRQIKALLQRHDVDLLFHCCGELTDDMVVQFASLDPAILSLGSSRNLWEDARLVPKTTVLYGNLPSKKFYSDELISPGQVSQQADELTEKMRQAGHPFILGSECDVLSVPGCECAIRRKVEAMLHAPRLSCGHSAAV